METSAYYEICPECGWEDDGQDDSTADEVWGGPNGRLSLTQARDEYAAYVTDIERPGLH
ncbi:CPCC family cysteine-rich protein [Streptomycetaceae bacterium NBC_01309]